MNLKFLLIVAMGLAFVAQNALAQTPRLVHYQGALKTDNGAPFNGTVDIEFSLYNRPVAEKAFWSETHKDVQVTDGQYSVLLGSENPLDLSFYEYFLEVKADGLPTRPRVAIVGSGYNFRLWFLFAAYTIVWLAIFGYLMSVSRRQKKLIADLNVLQLRGGR